MTMVVHYGHRPPCGARAYPASCDPDEVTCPGCLEELMAEVVLTLDPPPVSGSVGIGDAVASSPDAVAIGCDAVAVSSPFGQIYPRSKDD